MKKDVIFVSALAKCNEMKLLKKEQIIRMTSAADYDEALKMLYDYGYQRAGVSDIDGVIETQINALIVFILENSPDKHLTKVILNPFLYNNAKLYYKSRFVSVPDSFYDIDDAEIKKGILEKDYSSLPPALKKRLEELDKQSLGQTDGAPNNNSGNTNSNTNNKVNGNINDNIGNKIVEGKTDGNINGTEGNTSNIDGKMIDIAFNAAMFEDNLKAAKKSGDKSLKRYATAEIDLNNFVNFIRCRRLNRPLEYCAQMLYGGGHIALTVFQGLYGQSDKDIKDAFLTGRYSDTIQDIMDGRINIDMSIDKETANFSILEVMDMVSLSPLLHYVKRQLIEYRAVRMILTLLKNNARDEISKRLRGLYD